MSRDYVPKSEYERGYLDALDDLEIFIRVVENKEGEPCLWFLDRVKDKMEKDFLDKCE